MAIKDNKMERVVFREEYRETENDSSYLAVFPDSPARPGYLACLPFHFTWGSDFSDEKDAIVYEAFCEIDTGYYRKTNRIKKTSDEAARCYDVVCRRYGKKFRLLEKIVRNG